MKYIIKLSKKRLQKIKALQTQNEREEKIAQIALKEISEGESFYNINSAIGYHLIVQVDDVVIYCKTENRTLFFEREETITSTKIIANKKDKIGKYKIKDNVFKYVLK